jgi:hypothetical protein
MKRTLIAISLVGLSGCAGTVARTDAIACGTALLSAAIANPSPVAALALLTPECKALGKDVLDVVVAEVEKKLPAARANAARMMRR